MKLTYEDLRICHSLAMEAEDIFHRLERLAAYATKCTSSTSGGAALTGEVSDRVGNGVAAYVDLEREGMRKIEGFLEHVRFVERAIDGLEDSTQRKLLRLRYIDGLRWEEVEDEIAYSNSQRKRIHNKALENLGVDADQNGPQWTIEM